MPLASRNMLEEITHLFMKKLPSKEIMKRTRLRNKFLKDSNDTNKREYSKQCNYCVSLFRKSKVIL